MEQVGKKTKNKKGLYLNKNTHTHTHTLSNNMGPYYLTYALSSDLNSDFSFSPILCLH